VRALVFAVFAVAAACDRIPEPATVAPPNPRAQAAAARTALDDCRDTCEQNVIVTQAGEPALRSCRAVCDARYAAAAAPPHEVPSRITRAAPAHAPPPVRPR
jgi:hypothetical protein